MNEEKRFNNAPAAPAKESEDRQRTSAASRARNRTVMLTPEMTGQVRALLYQDPEDEQGATGAGKRDPLTELLPPMDWSRPDPKPAAGGSGSQETVRPAISDYTRDLASESDQRPPDRSGSTGKLDPDLVQEAVAGPGVSDSGRRSIPPAGGFTVNPNASRSSATAQSRRPAIDTKPRTQPTPTSKVVGFLVTYDKDKFGEVFEIRSGRWLITSRPTDHGEFILIEDETVSPLHAIVRATKEGKIQVLDQLSEFGTAVQRRGAAEEEEVSGTMVTVEHGDMLRLGERHFIVCLIPQTIAREVEQVSAEAE